MLDLSTQLRSLDGEILMEHVVTSEGPRVQPMTLGRVFAAALIHPFQDEPQLDSVEKLKRFVLAQRMVLGGEIELSKEEIDTVRTVVGKMYSPLIVGRAFEALDAAPPKGKRAGKGEK